MYLNAQGQRIPAPRTRDASTTPQGPVRDERGRLVHPGHQSRASGDWRRDQDLARHDSTDRSWAGPLEIVERDPSLSLELVDRKAPTTLCMRMFMLIG